MDTNVPKSIRNVDHLEKLLSAPTDHAIEAMARLHGDILLLGAGGKMGPSLARMIRRASACAETERRIIAVSRFSTPGLEQSLQRDGIETIRGDLLEEGFIDDLPDVPQVIFMTGSKFGTSTDASATWGTNVWLPSVVCQRFRKSRILAFSTGNVYSLVPVRSGGCIETDPLNPVGEYGMSALGRERIFEYFSRRYDIPTTIVRLNYAVEMRYGIVVDLARQVAVDRVIDLTMGYANVIWQADANAHALASMADAASPPHAVNVAGAELLDVRQTCEQLARRWAIVPSFRGTPASTALLNDASAAHKRYGKPRISLDQIIDWTADWVGRGGETWHKPTRFEVRDGQF